MLLVLMWSSLVKDLGKALGQRTVTASLTSILHADCRVPWLEFPCAKEVIDTSDFAAAMGNSANCYALFRPLSTVWKTSSPISPTRLPKNSAGAVHDLQKVPLVPPDPKFNYII